MTAPVSLITPTYHGDFDSCQLLCDSIDRFVTGFDKHYLVVSDDDLPLFSTLAAPNRVVLSESELLPDSLRPLPRFLKWKGRQYYWAFGAGLPVYGWHLQQLRKFAVTAYQPCPRVICIDSDICFVRPFDAIAAAGGQKSPLFTQAGAIDPSRPNHVVWRRNAYRLVGEQEPSLPADDHVGPMIVWDKVSVEALLERIELVTGHAWWKAVCKARNFSEYILYGVGVNTDPKLRDRHEIATKSLCHTYWGGPALDENGVKALIGEMDEWQSSICVQSHTSTSPALIRRVALSS